MLLVIILSIVLALVLAGLIGGWVGAGELMYPPRTESQASPADYGLPYEEVAFPSRDSLTLRGWFIPAPTPRATLVFAHGRAGNKDPDLQYAPLFHRHGYNLFLFDFRAHGTSEDGPASLVYFEQRDLLGAIDYLQARGIGQVGVIGFSMGAAVAMATAPASPAIRAVVADSGFAEVRRALVSGARERGIPRGIATVLSYLVLVMACGRLRVWLPAADPIRRIGQISPRPVLIIHGGQDKYIPASEARRLYQAAGEPRELWLVPEAGHRQVDQHRPEEYEAKVLGFFDRWLT